MHGGGGTYGTGDGAADGAAADDGHSGHGSQDSHGRNMFTGRAEKVVLIGGDVHGDVTVDGGSKEDERPHQVPVVVGPFVGREELLAEVDARWRDAVASGTVLIAVLRGEPGVGRRAAVRRWAHQEPGRFPFGELYLDYDRLRKEPDGLSADLTAALGTTLRGLGVPDEKQPATLDGLRERFLRETGKGRVLIALDNVTAAAQVSLLVPGSAGSVVLVTSRSPLPELAPDAGPDLPVRPLRPPQDLELLEKICGSERTADEPAAARRVAEYCAGLPVALRIAGALLASRPEMSVEQLAAQLANEETRLASLRLEGVMGEEISVSAVFGVAYEGLPAEEARAYRLLAFYPGLQWETGTAAAILGVGEREAATVLRALATAGLVARAGVGPQARYGFPALVGLHAGEEGRTASGDADGTERLVVERAAGYLLHRAAQADLAVQPDRLRLGSYARWLAEQPDADGFVSRHEALTWLDSERAELLDVLRAAAAHGLHREVAELAEVMTALYLNHRYLQDWEESGTLGVLAAEQLDDPGLEARLRCLLSRPLADLGMEDRQLDELTTAVARADASGEPLLRASAREFHGRYWDGRDPARAVTVHEESLALNEEAGDARGTAIAGYFLGCALDAAGQHAEAQSTLREACERFEAPEVRDARMGARALAALGAALWHLGGTKEARASLETAADRLNGLRALHYEAEACELLADIAGVQGDMAERQKRLQRALEVYEEAGSPRAEQVRGQLGHG